MLSEDDRQAVIDEISRAINEYDCFDIELVCIEKDQDPDSDRHEATAVIKFQRFRVRAEFEHHATVSWPKASEADFVVMHRPGEETWEELDSLVLCLYFDLAKLLDERSNA